MSQTTGCGLAIVATLIFATEAAAADYPIARAHRTQPQLISQTSSAGITIIDVGTLPGGTESQVTAINDNNQMSGYSDIPGDTHHSFLYSNGTLTDIGSLGASPTYATGINQHGDIVGFSYLAGGGRRAFLYSQGVMTNVGYLGDSSQAKGVNNSGQVVGDFDPPNSLNFRAFFSWDGTMIDLGTLPGGLNSVASDINDHGEIVGYSNLNGNEIEYQAFHYADGHMKALGTLGGAKSYAFAINNKGQIVGDSNPIGPNLYHAFLYSDGHMIDLGTLGGPYSGAYAINENGDVVGASDVPSGDGLISHAFVYSNGEMIDLNDLLPPNSGWILNNATGINNHGVICGNGIHHGQSRGFLLSGAVTPSTNQPPVVNNQSFSLAAGSPRGTPVGTVIASDPDDGQSLSYTLVSSNVARVIQLNSATGVLTVNNALAVRRPRTLSLVVRVTDNGSPALSDEATVTVNVVP